MLARKPSSWTSSASSIHASTCSGVGSSGSSGAAERIRASKPGSMSRPVEGLVEEVGDDPPALVVGQVGRAGACVCISLWVAGSSGDRPQHGLLDAQHADLRVDRRRVGGGDVGDLTSRSSTRRMVARSIPRSRSVRTSPSRASASGP